MVAAMQKRRKRLERAHPLKLWREKMGLGQVQVAKMCEVSQSFISYIESGLRVPMDDALERIIEFTGLPADAFVRTERFLEEQPNFLRKYRRPRG